MPLLTFKIKLYNSLGGICIELTILSQSTYFCASGRLLGTSIQHAPVKKPSLNSGKMLMWKKCHFRPLILHFSANISVSIASMLKMKRVLFVHNKISYQITLFQYGKQKFHTIKEKIQGEKSEKINFWKITQQKVRKMFQASENVIRSTLKSIKKQWRKKKYDIFFIFCTIILQSSSLWKNLWIFQNFAEP